MWKNIGAKIGDIIGDNITNVWYTNIAFNIYAFDNIII